MYARFRKPQCLRAVKTSARRCLILICNDEKHTASLRHSLQCWQHFDKIWKWSDPGGRERKKPRMWIANHECFYSCHTFIQCL